MKTSLFSSFGRTLQATREIELPRSFVVALLASFFSLALIFTDYWNIPDPLPIELMLLLATILLGAAWSFMAAARLRISFKIIHILLFVLLLGGVFWINYLPLTSDLPWRGDEDHHFRFVLALVRMMGKFPLYAALLILAALALVLFLAWRKPKAAVILALTVTGILLLPYPEESLFGSLRYPYINYWIYTLTLYPWGQLFGYYNEILFRIVPFLSAVALAWFYRRELKLGMEPAGLLWAFAVALIPSVFYYSSVLYLEMPAVFLMTWACLRAEKLLTGSFNEVRQDVGWYALILIGFIKETTLPFLVCFAAARAIVTLVRGIKGKTSGATAARVLGEVAIHFITLMPLAYYLLFRTIFADTRSYQFTPSNLLDPQVYLVLARSFLEQFGIFVLFFIAGVVLLVVRREYPQVLFYLLVIAGYSAFYLLEQKAYIGYSRFNLFMLPAFLAGAAVFIRWLTRWRKAAGYALVVAAIVSSLLLSPVNRDGTKKTGWGDYFFETSEQYYPVEESIDYLKEYHSKESTLFGGIYYEYTFSFYFTKLHWRPDKRDMLLSNEFVHNDQVNLQEALMKADEEGYDNLFFFVLGDTQPRAPVGSAFTLEKVIKNMAHQVMIFHRQAVP